MTDLTFAAPKTVLVPTADDRRFPVRRIFCVGRNYAEHAREMGADPDRESPFFFCKPADSVVVGGAPTPYPARTRLLHHEVELVVAIGIVGAEIPVAAALDHVWGYAVGIDMTRRDLQAEAKSHGRPWDMAKGFDASAPLGRLFPVGSVGHPHAGEISLQVNGEARQRADIGELIWNVSEIIAELSTLVRLEPGDLIYTGTPAGVGPVVRGDRITASIAGLGSLETVIV
ncbi:fumarylacetoacetate hydrolase family protein [Sphingomonas mali]|uniref:fumarylacetoacetate hydrolase family protein n=1 Tax=Sphingomonas mali TaxID=40682 RepID=UPI000A00D75E|nr:fumarylacetoacetate hydrolase family protein [Sphingomonas mali]